jgi:transcriptional regulator with XRE-family HTH domain
LWNLENRAEDKRPSAKILFEIAKALGVTLADLYGHNLTVTSDPVVDPTLAKFAAEEGLPAADIRMLASIEFRGDAPKTVDRWRYIYQAIRTSRELDRR